MNDCLDVDLCKVDTDPSFSGNIVLTDRKVEKNIHNHEEENYVHFWEGL